jgi:hypothetical protein
MVGVLHINRELATTTKHESSLGQILFVWGREGIPTVDLSHDGGEK